MSSILEVTKLTTGYGKRRVLEDIDLEVQPGEIIAILGHNGSGKSTLLKAIFGILPIWQGQIRFKVGVTSNQRDPASLIKRGVGYVPQKQGTFSALTVEENLLAAGHLNREKANLKVSMDCIYSLFPQLAKRRRHLALLLSGGERQSLALALGLVINPRLLLIDEPSLGLAPNFLGQFFEYLESLNKDKGITMVLVEQRVRYALEIADRAYILSNGKVKYTGTAESLRSEEALRKAYL